MDAFIKITNEISKRIILIKFSTLNILPKYVDNQRRTVFTKSVLTLPTKKKHREDDIIKTQKPHRKYFLANYLKFEEVPYIA